MSTPEVGDRVRLTREGVVTYADFGLIEVNGQRYRTEFFAVDVIEKAKKPLKVGDAVPPARFRELPAGAVVKDGNNGVLMFLPGERWACSRHDAGHPLNYVAYNRPTLVYLPEQ